MPIKESSDELNAPIVTANAVTASPRSTRSAKDYLALAIATCGVGYLPIAPGTWGSAVGIGLYLVLREWFASTIFMWRNWRFTLDMVEPLMFTALLVFVIMVLSGVGIWAGTRSEAVLGKKDPGPVVIDEVAGQLLTFVFIPIGAPVWIIVVGFLLFRGFDILKPYPTRRLEMLESGLGIMADDLMAGVYAAVSLLVIFIASSRMWA